MRGRRARPRARARGRGAAARARGAAWTAARRGATAPRRSPLPGYAAGDPPRALRTRDLAVDADVVQAVDEGAVLAGHLRVLDLGRRELVELVGGQRAQDQGHDLPTAAPGDLGIGPHDGIGDLLAQRRRDVAAHGLAVAVAEVVDVGLGRLACGPGLGVLVLAVAAAAGHRHGEQAQSKEGALRHGGGAYDGAESDPRPSTLRGSVSHTAPTPFRPPSDGQFWVRPNPPKRTPQTPGKRGRRSRLSMEFAPQIA